MKVEYVAKIEVPTTTKKQGVTDQYERVIGTGYPVAAGLVVTARHVLFPPDRDPDQPIRVIWKHEDAPEPFHTASLGKDAVLYESADFDIAVLAYDTGRLVLPVSVLADATQFPKDGVAWKSYGYPTAGKERGQRIKSPARGTCFEANPNHYIQWLHSEGNVDDDLLWQGMSGAPVFDAHNRLVAVIIRTPAEYLDAQGQLKPAFKNRLLAASIPYLLTPGKCDGFRELVTRRSEAEALLPPAKVADEFTTWLCERLAQELTGLQLTTTVLHEQLISELGLVNNPDAKSAKVNKAIAEALLALEFEDAVDVLAATTGDCVVEGGQRYASSLPLARIKTTAEIVLGWLVLRAIDEQQLSTILPICHQQAARLFFRLTSVQSLLGIEVVMARRLNRRPDLNNRVDSEQQSRYQISLPEACFKWDGKESVRRVFIEIWNKVFAVPSRQKTLGDSYTADDMDVLNAQLRRTRTHRRHPEHFYLSFRAADYQACPAFVESIYQDLLGKLSEMTVIEYGTDGQHSHLFVIPEADMRACILQFYREINGEMTS